MPQRSRFTVEEKAKIVNEYLEGKLGPKEFTKIYGSSWTLLYNWVRLYKARGVEGLTPAVRTRKYAPETKMAAVLDYKNGLGSIVSICEKYDITDCKSFRQWIKVYNSRGYFKRPNSGGGVYMAKGRETTFEERVEIVSHCIANNKDYGTTVKKYGVSYNQLYAWVRKYEKDGSNSLADRRGRRKDEASMTDVEKLQAQLKLKEAENLRLQMENELLKKLEEIEGRRGIS